MKISEEFIREKLSLAYQAAQSSPDPSNQNGAVVFRDGQFVLGFNGTVNGIEATPELMADRDRKLIYIEHAERSAILEADRLGIGLQGAAMFCPWAACAECARAINRSGISDLYVHQERMDTTPDRWKASVEQGLAIIRAGGTVIHFIAGPIDASPIIVNGTAWSPRTW